MDNITEYEIRKRDMKELWKATFHDSDRYIDLVFDTYFSLENTFVNYHENRLIAALLGVEYEFQILTKEEKKEKIRGMYLCGLATHPNWRGRGIMTELMKEAETNAALRGFDMTFLIPADDKLREYYRRRGYKTVSWRETEAYRREDEAGNIRDRLHIYSVDEEMKKDGNRSLMEELAEWCMKIESTRAHSTILHSREDMLAAMVENENCVFLTESTFDPEYPNLTKVAAVAFPELSDDPEGPLKVVGLFIESAEQESGIKEEREDDKQRRVRDIERKTFDRLLSRFRKQELEIVRPVGKADDIEDRGVSAYAMIKKLQENEHESENENSLFEISLMLD